MEIRLPKLGEGAESGTVATLFVTEGETLQKDQPLIELESEKAVATIPAPAGGRITRIHVKPGDVVKVGQVLVTVEDGAAPGAAAEHQPPPAATPAPARPVAVTSSPKTIPGIPIAAPPSVRKLAAELGIDLSRVTGSEAGGRITLADLRAHIQQWQQAPAAPAPQPATPAEPVDFSKWGPVTRQPLSALRRVIARRMHDSWTTIPHVTQFAEADLTTLQALRQEYAPAYARQGVRLTVTPLILRALVPVLKNHPIFNASLDEATQELVLKQSIHFGIAVDTEQGLIVPVLRDANRKHTLDLARELDALTERTRQRKVTADELRGSSFTISNQGAIGGGHFTPIINRPDVAILGLGRGALTPVVRNGAIEPRLMLPLCLSYDHRVIDGAAAARFVVELVHTVENLPAELVTL